jgi:hypothetical protein
MKGDPMKKMSEEALKGMTETELRSTARRLESNVTKLRKNKQNSKDLEMEICYIQRELELRRRFGHMRTATESQNDETVLEFEQP